MHIESQHKVSSTSNSKISIANDVNTENTAPEGVLQSDKDSGDNVMNLLSSPKELYILQYPRKSVQRSANFVLPTCEQQRLRFSPADKHIQSVFTFDSDLESAFQARVDVSEGEILKVTPWTCLLTGLKLHVTSTQCYIPLWNLNFLRSSCFFPYNRRPPPPLPRTPRTPAPVKDVQRICATEH